MATQTVAVDPEFDSGAEQRAAVEVINDLFRQAKRLHMQGRMHEAEIVYARLLELLPGHVQLLHLRGVLNAQLGRHTVAIELLNEALALQPDHADARSNLGNCYMAIGEWSAAVEEYRQVVKTNPAHADAWSNLGTACLRQNAPQEAAECFIRCIKINPDHVNGRCNLALLHQQQGHYRAALAHFRAVLKQQPDHHNALICMANILLTLGHLDAAAAAVKRALAVPQAEPDALLVYAEVLARQGKCAAAESVLAEAGQLTPRKISAYFHLGQAFMEAGRLQRAEQCLRDVIAIDPEHADALCNLGVVLRDLGQHEESEARLRQALRLCPAHVDALCNLSNVYTDRNELVAAARLLRRALFLQPDHASSHANLGFIFWEAGKIKTAERHLRKAIHFAPNHAAAHSNLGMVLLTRGHYREGWQEYEWRRQRREYRLQTPVFQQPEWRGEALTGKRLLIYSEQGLGDFLQFLRYADALSAEAGQVLLQAPVALHRLCRQRPHGVQLVRDAADHEYDFQVSLLSLPNRVFDRLGSCPVAIPYLAADEERVAAWRTRIACLHGRRVGLVWQGSKENVRDKKRSIALAEFGPLLALPGYSFISLQKGEGREQLANPGTVSRIADFDNELDAGDDAFIDTAALIANLDLVICCDTAVAHLAGALGKPVWVLLPFVADFRWLQTRSDTAWYPTMRLFRQKTAGEWAPVMAAVATALQAFS